MAYTFNRGAAVGTVSALALAIAGQASAVSFDAGNTTVGIGGYVKGDMIYNFNEDQGDSFTGGVGINTSGTSGAEGQFRAHAKQSRLSITTSTPTDHGKVTTLIQGDFFTSEGNEAVSNSRGFRIRHAFGQWNGIGFGQTWSNFMPLVALPPSLDFGGPQGYVFNRQAQARYTTQTGNGALSFSLENPEARIANSGDDHDALPDVTAKYKGKAGSLSYSVSGVLTFLETDDGSNSESATGFGTMLAAKHSAGGTTIGGNLGYFDGANRYLWTGGGGTFTNGYLVNGDIETAGELALMAYVDQAVSNKTNMALIWGYTKLDDEDFLKNSAATESLMTVFANVRHKATKNVTFGAELQYGQKELFNDDDGDATRLQVSGTYAF